MTTLSPAMAQPRTVSNDGGVASRRGFETVRDMVFSLGAVFAFVAILLLVTLRHSPDPIKVVDPTSVKQGIASNAPYQASVAGQVAGWRVTSARVSAPGDDPFAWKIGYFTTAGNYAAAGQSNASVKTYERDEQVNGASAGSVNIKGQKWTQLQRADGKRRWLVRTDRGVTTLIVGTGGFDELEKLAKTLVPAKAKTSVAANAN